MIGEFGYEWDWNKDFNQFAPEMDFDYKRGLWYGLFSPTPILPMTWWWEFFDERNMTPYFKGVREISDAMLKAGKGSFEETHVIADALRAQGMKCGDTYFVYLLNESNDTHTSSVSFPVATGKQYTLRSYDPESRTYQVVTQFTVYAGSVNMQQVTLAGRQGMVYVLGLK